MIHEVTRHTRYQSHRQHKGDTMEIKSKLYLRIMLLINYMMEKNLSQKKDRKLHLDGLIPKV